MSGLIPYADLLRELGTSAQIRSGPECQAYSQDLAGLETRAPAVVVETSDEGACARTLAFAARHDCEIAVRGAGQSCNGQTLSSDLVLSFLPPATGVVPGPDGQVHLHGGHRWIDIARGLQGSGWSVPVSTANLATSVAGTLSNCGFGARSIKRGCQIDHVRDYRLIFPDGQIADLSPGHPAFGLGLGSLGQAGLVSQVNMSMAREAPTCRAQRKVWNSRAEMMNELEALAGMAAEHRPDCFYAFLDRGQLEGRAIYGVLGYDGDGAAPAMSGDSYVSENFDLDLHNDVAAWLRGFAGAHCLFSDFVFDYEGFASFYDQMLGPDMPEFLTAAYILLSAPPPPGRPDFAFDPRAGRREMSFGLGLYCLVPRGHDLTPVLAFLARASDRCERLSGRPLLYGASAYASGQTGWRHAAALKRLGALPGARTGFNGAWRGRVMAEEIAGV